MAATEEPKENPQEIDKDKEYPKKKLGQNSPSSSQLDVLNTRTINQVQEIERPDQAIILNISTQVVITFTLFFLFLLLRRKNLWLYSPNTRHRRNHPAYYYSNTFISWAIPIFTIKDVDLVSIIGLDSFMMLQILKLLYRIFFILTITLIPLFVIYYKHGIVNIKDLGDKGAQKISSISRSDNSTTGSDLFLLFNIDTVKSKRLLLIIPIFYVYFVTILVFYIVYIYYKKYIVLRQTYIKSPAILTPLSTLKRLSLNINSNNITEENSNTDKNNKIDKDTNENDMKFSENIDDIDEGYVNYVNLKSRTVILSRIPSFVETDDDLRLFVDALGCGTVDECVLLMDMDTIDALVDEQDNLIRKMEDEIEKSFRKIINKIKVSKKKILKQKNKKDKQEEENKDLNDEKKREENKIDETNIEKLEFDVIELCQEIENLEKKEKTEHEEHGFKENEIKEDESENADEKNLFDNFSTHKKKDENFDADNDKEKKSEVNDTQDKTENKENDENQNNDGSISEGQYLSSKYKKIDPKNKEDPEKNDNSLMIKKKKEMSNLSKKYITSKNKYIQKQNKIDKLTYILKKIKTVQSKILSNLTTVNIPKSTKSKDSIIELMNQNNTLYTRFNPDKDISFFSFSQIFNFRRNYHFFSLDLPTNTKCGFVSFKSAKSANIICQSLISSKIFSCKAEPAPDPDDVIWENVNKGEVTGFFKRLMGNIIFIVFCVVFYLIVFAISSFLQFDRIIETIPSLESLGRIKWFRDTFDSVVIPAVYNITLILAPFILTVLIYYQGVFSYSLLYLKLMSKYGYFLLFNGFIALLVSGTFYSIIKSVGKGDFKLHEFCVEIGANLKQLSLFFLNTIIQRMMLGNILVIFKPVKFVLVIFSETFNKRILNNTVSKRSKRESMMPDTINFGFIYPIILIIFPMAISYSVICPLILVTATLYFVVTYFTYKHEFIYCIENQNEAGGIHFKEIVNQLIVGLFIFHCLTMCQFTSYSLHIETMCIAPIIIITFMYKRAINKMFGKSISHYPLNEQEEIYMDNFTRNVVEKRKELVKMWDQALEPDDIDDVNINEIIDIDIDKEGKKECIKIKDNFDARSGVIIDTSEDNMLEREKVLRYPYRGVVRGIGKIMFPKGFYKKMRAIKKKDKLDELEIFTERKEEEEKPDKKTKQKQKT